MMYSSHPELAVQTTPETPFKTGVIVLSMDCRILHITDGAGDLACLFDQGPGRLQSHSPRAPLCHPLMDVFHTVLATLEKHIAAEDWSPFEAHHFAHSMNDRVLLRGFGIPDQARRQQSRVVLTLHYRSRSSPL